MGEKLPVLIAALSAETARELEEASRLGADVWVALEREPTQAGPHVLEVYTAEIDVPIRLLAEPLGSRSELGTAIRLRPWPQPKPEKSPPAPAALPRATLAGGRFELLSRIGEGSIGAVYRARHTVLNNIVAVKVLHKSFQTDAEFGRRFYEEALAMSRLNHANLIGVHDFGQEPDGLLYLAMPCVEGLTLRQIQQRERRFDVPRIVGWMLQVCAGLGHAHARGFIHRDVKPDNMMIVTEDDDDGQSVETVKVLDFGFAVPPSVSGEVAQRLAGTPVYMSPEQCRGEELDARSDLYACGIMMYELAAGSVPFLTNDLKAIREMQMYTPAPLIAAKRPDIDPRYERIVQRALSKRREDRQANMMELRAELKDLLLPESIPALRAAPVAAPPKSKPKPVAEPSPAEDWLERGTSYDMQSTPTSAEKAPESGYVLDLATPTQKLTDRLAKDASSWLGELSRERDPQMFARRVEELEGAVRGLAERGDAKALSRVSAVVNGLAENVGDDAGRQALAAVARLFASPELLTPIASSFLLRESSPGPDAQRDAANDLLAQARLSGAVALYSARTRLAADATIPGPTVLRGRVTFVTTMKAFGASARPVLRAALEKIYEQASTGHHRGAPELAEDVLLSIPKGEDEAVGELIVKYARSTVPTVARAAARALPRVWGMRARSVLVRLIQHEDDGVCMAAVIGLHELDAVDVEVVARIAAQVDAGRVRTQQLQMAFITALKSATAAAHAEALAVLARMPR